MRLPCPLATKKGAPPTPRKARTGLLTPPGITRCACSKSDVELGAVMRAGSALRLLPVQRDEVPRARIPAKGAGLHDPPLHDGEHDIGRVWIGGLAVDQRVVLVCRREVRAGVDVGVVDGDDPKSLGFAPADRDQVLRVDVVGGPGAAGMALGILGVELILDVAAR